MTTRFEDVPALLEGLARLPPERPALTFYKGRTCAGRWTYGAAARRCRSIDPSAEGRARREARRSRRRPRAQPAGGPGALPRGDAARRRCRPAQSDHGARGLGLHPRALGGARHLRHARAARPAHHSPPTSSAPSRNSPHLAMEPAVARRRRRARDRWRGRWRSSFTPRAPPATRRGWRSARGACSPTPGAWPSISTLKTRRSSPCCPLYHAHALGFGLMTTLTTGGHLVFMERFDPFAWGEVAARRVGHPDQRGPDAAAAAPADRGARREDPDPPCAPGLVGAADGESGARV